jgi:hypothetical protein
MLSNHAYVMERDIVSRFMCSFEPKFQTPLRAKLKLGWPLSSDDVEHIPRTLTIGVTELTNHSPPSVIHCSYGGGPWIINDIVKSQLEQLEPDTHSTAR